MNSQLTHSNFGLLIAYLIPGFVTIWGLSGLWPAVIGCANVEGCSGLPSLVGFLNSTVAAVAAGMAVSAVRFVLIDHIHEQTGLKRPVWNGVALQKNLAAVSTVVDQHYRYYQFHANMIIAGIIAYGAYLYNARVLAGFPEMVLLAIVLVFWVTARDNLRKYYQNLDAIFTHQRKGTNTMSNGMHPKQHENEAGKKKKDQDSKSKPVTKPADKENITKSDGSKSQ